MKRKKKGKIEEILGKAKRWIKRKSRKKGGKENEGRIGDIKRNNWGRGKTERKERVEDINGREIKLGKRKIEGRGIKRNKE